MTPTHATTREHEDSNVPNRPERVTARGARAMSQWLGDCLKLGWPKSSLDALETIWWDYHDGNGNWKAKEVRP